jgi:DNA topoisomerase-1
VQVARVAASEDPAVAAEAASLNYASDDNRGIARQRHGKSFTYARAGGARVRDRATLSRIRALAIPPAWTDVWISPDPDGHIQATGRDARGRKQYRYHPRWREVRDETKFHRLAALVRALPKIRTRVTRDLSRAQLDREKVLATVVALMERAQLRVGNEEYARANGSYGATTLRNRHARVHGDTLELAFRAKGGILRRVRVADRRLARVVRRCQALPGQRLFQYVDGAGGVHPITSSDVNDYLRAASGGPFTAKDYRTWAATMAAALLMCARERPRVKDVIARVADQLGHTPAVCKASYIHPQLLEDYTADRLKLPRVASTEITVEAMRKIESRVARYLARR